MSPLKLLESNPTLASARKVMTGAILMLEAVFATTATLQCFFSSLHWHEAQIPAFCLLGQSKRVREARDSSV